MIAYIKGIVIIKEYDFVIVRTGGVGYKIICAQKTLEKINEENEVELFCVTRIRKEALELYGVQTPEALQTFELLNKISGVGPKIAVTLSSYGTILELKKAIETGALGAIKGIGAKKLQKILLELTGKIENLPQYQEYAPEAMQGLLALGFTKKEATQALSQIPKTITNPEDQLKEALKYAGR